MKSTGFQMAATSSCIGLMPELRLDPLRGEWVAYATARNDRTFLPAQFCPLCPGGYGGASEVPLADFDVAVFANRFPAFGPDPSAELTRGPASSGCEVIVYSPDHDQTLADLSLDQVRLLIEVWVERYLTLGRRPGVAFVYIFENKGEEIGVTLHHPHGQIYAMPFVPPIMSNELEHSAEYLQRTGRCLHCDEIRKEAHGPRLVFTDGGMSAFVPRTARWPFEVHVYPTRHVASLAELDPSERLELGRALLRLTRTYDRHFGFSTPYVMAIHQAPTGGRSWPAAHLHIEFYPPHRRPDRLKYLAGVELGAGTFVNDTLPEQTAAQLRTAVSSS